MKRAGARCWVRPQGRVGEGRDKVDASCTGTGAGIAPHSGVVVVVVIVVMAMALVMAPKKKAVMME